MPIKSCINLFYWFKHLYDYIGKYFLLFVQLVNNGIDISIPFCFIRHIDVGRIIIICFCGYKLSFSLSIAFALCLKIGLFVWLFDCIMMSYSFKSFHNYLHTSCYSKFVVLEIQLRACIYKKV